MNSRTSQVSIRLVVAIVAISFCCIFIGCDRQRSERAAGHHDPGSPLIRRVVAVSYPLQYLTQRITGDAIEVSFPVPADVDPQSWRPDRESIGQMQSADLIIANGTGASYAKWLTTVTLPESRIRNTASRGLALADYIAIEDVQVVHSHGPEGEHSHPTMVARTWLDPAIAKKQAIYIADELKDVYPDLADGFQSRLNKLVSELDELSELLEKIDSKENRVVLSATPILKYFTRAAEVEDHHLIWFENPSAEQAKKDLEISFGQLQESRPRLMLFGGEGPSNELIEVLDSSNLGFLTLDPLDQKPVDGDYLSGMRENIEALTSAMENNGP